MTKNNLYHGAWRLRATGTLVLALALSTFPAAFSRAVKAQTPAKATAQTPAKATTSPAIESKGGQKEGIKVHGHWTIDVRNPDGKLVTHREFENALVATGAAALSDFLARQKTVGEWSVIIGSSPSSLGPCAGGFPCIILEVNSVFNSSAIKTLTLSAPGLDANGQPLPNYQKFVLSGTATAQQAGQINVVETDVVYQGSTKFQLFTQATLAAPVNGSCPQGTQCLVTVSAGQIIQVTVVISFS